MGIRELGAALRQRREDLALPQAAVARASGIDPSYLSRIEKGDTAYKSVGPDVLRGLSDVLGIDEDALIDLLYGTNRRRPRQSRDYVGDLRPRDQADRTDRAH